jgi:hypothetical protein
VIWDEVLLLMLLLMLETFFCYSIVVYDDLNSRFVVLRQEGGQEDRVTRSRLWRFAAALSLPPPFATRKLSRKIDCRGNAKSLQYVRICMCGYVCIGYQKRRVIRGERAKQKKRHEDGEKASK